MSASLRFYYTPYQYETAACNIEPARVFVYGKTFACGDVWQSSEP